MTIVEATPLSDSEAQEIVRADMAALGIQLEQDQPDWWTIMFAALDRAIEAHSS